MYSDKARMHSIYRYWIDWLYPNRCPCCNRCIDYNADFCAGCKEELTLFEGNFHIPYTDGFTAYCVYGGNIRDAVLRFKYDPDGNSYYAFARGIAEALEKSGFSDDTDIIVPVPASKGSMKKRGYNQSELIAKELRYLIGIPYANALVKIKETKEQKRLGAAERAENVKGVFSAAGKYADRIKGENVLIIDDVCTTGSTLSEAARVLRNSGAGKIYAAVLAKTPLK